MKHFDHTDEGSAAENRMPSERLQAFTQTLFDALVPEKGPCSSVQGELLRANERLQSEYFRNGMGNYFVRNEPDDTLAHNYYGELLLFLLDTMIANRNRALTDTDVAYFTEIRREVEPQWLRGLRSDELFYKAEDTELTNAESEELAEIDEQPRGPVWEDLFLRARRCIANWCLANPALIDRQGRPVTHGQISDVMHVLVPPPAPPTCPRCKGKGFIAPATPGDFPSLCACKK